MDKNQITVRVTDVLDRKIGKAARSKGLSKASWVRQLIIETLETTNKQKDEANA